MLRHHARGTFPAALLFPGGAVDPDDAVSHWSGIMRAGAALTHEVRAFRIVAVRETVAAR